ncbi:nucleoside hydrolase [Tropicimonas sp.]|uniref:nucleoside hydrolase n=1 Tax=Tropicimonas sp. TaxID=2067044 RepID=UPI003A84450E
MPPRKIIIDTDPGQDDAVAILLALASPEELDVLAITVVAGNVPLIKTSRNARVVCELAGRPDMPVHEGCGHPLERMLITAEHVHGKSGLDGCDLPEPTMPVSDLSAVEAIIHQVRRHPPGTVTLCPLGPLTNIATALKRAPDIAGRLAGIVLMGGGFFEGGNITPAAEFNIYVDPEAADIVMQSGVDITMMPLDVTHQALITREWLDRIAALGTPVSRAVCGWLDFYERFDIEKYGGNGGPLHDPCVIAHLLKPGLFEGRFINVEIETASDLTRGMTVADWWGVSGRAPNANFIAKVDAPAFFDLLADRLARL